MALGLFILLKSLFKPTKANNRSGYIYYQNVTYSNLMRGYQRCRLTHVNSFLMQSSVIFTLQTRWV